jgi:hypothetical protein
MLPLYHGSGSPRVQLVGQHNSAIWGLLRRNVYEERSGSMANLKVDSF